MKPNSIASTIDVLTPMWQRLLNCVVRPSDNFFELGGDSLLAVQLFNEISDIYGRDLSPVMIYHAPTIEALAALIDEPIVPSVPRLVLLRPGTMRVPVFMTHGLGGTVMDFYQVLRHLETDHPIYGMQAKGIDARDAPFDCIEGMAEYYLSAVKDLQPHGPYFLIGYSLGGLVTFEMAHRLTSAGEEVALLAMLDTYPHLRFLSLWQQALLMGRLAVRHARILRKKPIAQALSYVFRPAERRSHIPGDSTGRARFRSPQPALPIMTRARESAYVALGHYRPTFYHGKVWFVRAEITTDFPQDAAAVWEGLTERLHVDTVPGDHLEIMTVYAGQLAGALSRYIRATSRNAVNTLAHQQSISSPAAFKTLR